MKLLSITSRTVNDLADLTLPPYAVLSHTRDTDASFSNEKASPGFDSDIRPSTSPNTGYPPRYTTTPSSILYSDKLEQACRHALRSRIEHLWIDELCIDKTSMVDLDDAVNGSRRRLRNSAVCFVYLHDLPADVTLDNASAWRRCRYWKRSWTLQELILSPRVKIFDREWNYRGDKNSPELAPLLSNITSIPRSVLLDSTTLSDIALAVRISWSAGRVAERGEDTAYALVAITEATLPVRYGEGAERAFLRLQEELLRDTRDGSLLAWRSAREGEVRGLLARSPSEFGHFAAASVKDLQRPWVFNGKVRFSSKGIELQSRVCKGPGCVLLSIGQKRQDLGTGNNIAICFREWNGVYVRVAPASRVSSAALRSWHTIDVARDVDESYSHSLRSLFNSMPCRLEIAKRGSYEDTWQQSLMPRVVLDNEEVVQVDQKDQDQDTDMKMESDEIMLALTPQKTRTSSNNSDGSYVHVAMTGSWVGSQEQQHHHPHPQHHYQAQDQIDHSGPGVEDDGLFSVDSDPGSMTSTSASASASVSESDWEDDSAAQNVRLLSAKFPGQEDDDGIITETRSTTTLAAETNDRNSLKNLIMKSSIREQVLATAYERVRSWISTVHYVTPPQDRLSPQSRINTTSWFAEPESLARLNSTAVATAGAAAAQQQTVTVFRPDGFFHLACPFFAADPERHRSCVLDGKDLQSVTGVLRHIREHHPSRAYCARCHLDFDIPEERDAHMMERTCVRVGHPAPQGDASRKGVAEEDVRQLRKTDLHHRHESEAQRWRRIYWALFPDLWPDFEDEEDEYEGDEEKETMDYDDEGRGGGIAEEDCDPYLRAGNGFAVSLVHDFWSLHRKDCVAAALEACGHDLDELNDDDALAALYQVTLKELISKIYHEYHL